MHATPARKKRRASDAAATGDMRTPAALKGQAQNLDALVEAAAAAYSSGCRPVSSPARSPNSRRSRQPGRLLAAGDNAAAASPEKGKQARTKGDTPGAARNLQLAQAAARRGTPQTNARGRPVGQTAAKPWWVV